MSISLFQASKCRPGRGRLPVGSGNQEAACTTPQHKYAVTNFWAILLSSIHPDHPPSFLPPLPP